MTTLTVNIPDDNIAVIEAIKSIVGNIGGNVSVSSEADYNSLSKNEFDGLMEAYKEALQIKDGKVAAIPVSELWND